MPTEPRLSLMPADQLDELAGVLGAAGLPAEDLSEPGRRFYRLDGDSGPAGWAGLEIYGADALLRSVVVPDDRRGGGVGARLVGQMIAAARDLGADRLWLLTMTAAGFFEKLGFEQVERSAAPEAIRASREFRDICPASATCMVKPLSSD